MKIEILKTNGKWLTNGKPYEQLNPNEKKFMDAFFKELKINSINQNQNEKN